jgi:hypothetical protein
MGIYILSYFVYIEHTLQAINEHYLVLSVKCVMSICSATSRLEMYGNKFEVLTRELLSKGRTTRSLAITQVSSSTRYRLNDD